MKLIRNYSKFIHFIRDFNKLGVKEELLSTVNIYVTLIENETTIEEMQTINKGIL